jgi:hypothetical protein
MCTRKWWLERSARRSFGTVEYVYAARQGQEVVSTSITNIAVVLGRGKHNEKILLFSGIYLSWEFRFYDQRDFGVF